MQTIDAIRNFVASEIWQAPQAIRTPPKRFAAGALRWIYAVVREITEGALDERAMSLVYTTLLSLAPLLAVCFSVLKAFGVHNQLQPFLLQVLSPLGEERQELTERIIGFVENIQVGVLGALGLALLFYSVISLLGKIEECFNRIWRVGQQRSWRRRFTDYLSVVLIGPVLAFSALGITASMASGELVRWIVSLEPFGTVYYLIGLIVPYVLIIAAFTFVYAFMPNTRVQYSAALVGAIVAGIAWKAVGWAFGAIVVESAGYNAIYSGFAIVILFMIWLYVSWLILLIGGVIAFHFQHPLYLRYRTRSPVLGHDQREKMAFLLMHLIGKVYYAGDPPLSLDVLAERTGMPREIVSQVLQPLVNGRILTTLGTEPESYLPARAPETLPLREIHRAIRDQDGVIGPDEPVRGEGTRIVDDLNERLERSAASVLDQLTLRDLVVGEGGTSPGARFSVVPGASDN